MEIWALQKRLENKCVIKPFFTLIIKTIKYASG